MHGLQAGAVRQDDGKAQHVLHVDFVFVRRGQQVAVHKDLLAAQGFDVVTA